MYDKYLLCMIKVRVRLCTCKFVEKVITLGKLIGLLLLFCPLSSQFFFFFNSKNTRNVLMSSVALLMETIFLVSFIATILSTLRNSVRRKFYSLLLLRPNLKYT